MNYISRLLSWSGFMRIILLLTIALIITCESSRAEYKGITADNGLSVEAKPEWIENDSLDFEELTKSVEPINGLRMLLLSTQSNYTNPVTESYSRIVTQVTNTTILQENSTVGLEYVPAYQTYSVINLNIIRGDDIINVREKAIIRFNQLEAPLGADQFESPKVVMIFIPGLRVGDIIDFSFLIRGGQEALQGTIRGQFNHGAYFAVGRLSARLLVPKDQNLNIFGIKSPAAPVINKTDRYDEYRWIENAVSPSSPEDDAPLWWPTFPVTHYSSFKSWAEVRGWFETFFVSHKVPDSEIDSLAKELTEGLSSETEKLRAVLTFMQREIRYVGMELGRNNLRPFPATTVLERRFGDCKDQTNLLLEILKCLKINAFPVLTNAIEGRWMMTAFPTPLLFNHVFVYAEAEKHGYWIDPTMPIFEGKSARLDNDPTVPILGGESIRLDNDTKRLIFGDKSARLDNVNYGYGLKLDGVSTELIEIPEGPARSEYLVTIMPEPPQLRNRTKIRFIQILSGDLITSFELVRDQIGEEKHDELIMHFAEKLISGEDIMQQGKPEIIGLYNINKKNKLNYTSEYNIQNPWQLDKEKKRYELWSSSQLVRQYLISFENVENRVAPGVLNYPVDIEETFRLVLPDWDFDECDDTIESQYQYFNRKIWYDKGLIIRFQYRTKDKIVPVSDMESFNKDIESIRDKLSYYVYTTPNKIKPDLIKLKLEKPKIFEKEPE